MMDDTFPIGKLATLVFMMMGPIGLIPTFAGLTGQASPALRGAIALRAFGYACVALSVAVGIGAGVLGAWGASRPALVIAAGLLLALASLRHILAAPGGASTRPGAPEPTPAMALSPLAFPSIVTPHGVGVLITFVAYAPHDGVKGTILGVALGIMTLNLLAMLFAHRIMRIIGPVPLTILGAVFGVLQVALGIEMIASGAALWSRSGA